MDYHYLDHTEVAQVVAKMTDGSTWLCEYDTSGHLVPVKQISPPPKKPKELPPTPPPSMGTPPPGMGPAKPFTGKHGTYNPLAEPAGPGTRQNGKSTAIIPQLDDTVFRSRLSSIMTDNKYDRHLKGRTRGKLDMTRLSKVPTGSSSVFTQKMTRKNKLYNVVLVVDQSGSMQESGYEDKNGDWHGGKMRMVHAADIATFIAKSVVGINVDLAILGFNHYQTIYKQFGQPITDYQGLHTSLVNGLNLGASCNHDYDAIARSYELLKGRPGKNIVLFISDGSPATCGHLLQYVKNPGMYDELRLTKGHLYREDSDGVHEMWFDRSVNYDNYERDRQSNLNHLVKAHDSLATTIGIGIQTKSWQVPENIRVDDLGDMKTKVLEVLQRKIKRG